MQAPENLKPLTTMRILAALWVVLYDYWPHLTPGPSPALVSKGYLGVELFFVLSGFILCHVYLPGFGGRAFSYFSFLWARLSRIYPVHLATLFGLGGLILAANAFGAQAGGDVIVWGSLPGQILLLQAWGLTPDGGWNHPSWSISAEWFAYLTFPGFAWATWRLRERPWVAAGAAVIALLSLNIVFAGLAGFSLTHATIAWGALRIVPCFALGCATYLLWRAGVVPSQRFAKALTLAAVVGIALLALAGGPDAFFVVAFGALILGLAALSSTGSRLLTAKAGVYLGEVSFAVYMVTIPWALLFMKGAEKVLGVADGLLPWTLWIAMTLGVIPCAMVVHHLVERPARTIMRAWEASGFRIGPENRLRERMDRFALAKRELP